MSTTVHADISKAAKEAVAQKYGPNPSIVVIDDGIISAGHYVLYVAVQDKRHSTVVIANVLKVHRGWNIQVYEMTHQVFKPA